MKNIVESQQNLFLSGLFPELPETSTVQRSGSSLTLNEFPTFNSASSDEE
jgi:hypothetical protein